MGLFGAIITCMVVVIIVIMFVPDMVIHFQEPECFEGCIEEVEYIGGAFGYRSRSIVYFEGGRIFMIYYQRVFRENVNVSLCLKTDGDGYVFHSIDYLD